MSDQRCADCGGPLPSPFNYCPQGEGGSECRAPGAPRTTACTPETVEMCARRAYAAWRCIAADIQLDDEAISREPEWRELRGAMASLGALLNMNVN